VAQDIFLKVQGQKSGKINGEADDTDHKDEVELLGWSWGMTAPTDIATAQASGRFQMRMLNITKNVDKASAPLMTVLTSNEVISKALITVRKAGKTGKAIEYLKVTLEQARIVTYQVHTGVNNPAVLIEEVGFAFQKITVDYTPQRPDGQPGAGLSFSTDWSTAS
jgi:type VI secretion system secreted protein Hcp